MAEAKKDLNEIARNLRRSNAGIKLGRQLFDPSYQNNLSANQIANLLRDIGLPIGNSERITVASAQLIVSGGAFVDNVGKSATLQSVVAPAKAVLDGAIGLLTELGLMKRSDPAARGLSFLGSAAMVAASGGLNIVANIAFLFELAGFIFEQDKPVDMIKFRHDLLLQSAEKLKATLIRRIDAQAETASQLFGNYQSGQISVFQMLGGVAQSAPDLFLKYFPEFGAFIPYTAERLCESTSKVVYAPASEGTDIRFRAIYEGIDNGSWPWLNASEYPYGVIATEAIPGLVYGGQLYTKYRAATQSERDYVAQTLMSPPSGTWLNAQAFDNINSTRQMYLNMRATNTDSKRFQTITETFCHDIATIKKYQKAELQEIFLKKYVALPFEPYRFLQTMTKEMMRIHGYPPEAGLAPHPNPVFPRISIQTLALLSSLPPYFSRLDASFDLTKVLIAMELTPNDLGYENFGEEYLQSSEISSYQVGQSAGITFNGVNYWNEAQSSYNQSVKKNNLDIKRAIALDNAGYMNEFAKIPNAQRVMKEFGTMPYIPPYVEQKMFAARTPMERDYRNIQNYWAAISVMDGIRKDPYFQDAKGLSLYKEMDRLYPTASEFEEEHKRLQFISVGRKLNEEAKKNIAFFFGEKDFRKLRFKPMREGEIASVLPPPITVRGNYGTKP